MRRLIGVLAAAVMAHGCASPTTPPATAKAAPPVVTAPEKPLATEAESPVAPNQAGAQLRVTLKGRIGCSGSVLCSARLSIVADGTTVTPDASIPEAPGDAIWQARFGYGSELLAPPDGDLPILATGSHLLVWSVTAQRIATDPPAPPPESASRCWARIVVPDDARTIAIRIAFSGASELAPEFAGCTIEQLPPTTAEPQATPGSVAGTAILPSAPVPTNWRAVKVVGLDAFRDPGFRVALGVAPDGAFIAIPNGNARAALPVLRSVDGESWAMVADLPDSKDGWIRAVAWNGQALVVTGGSSGRKRTRMWVSPDGITWSAIPAAQLGGLSSVESLAASSAGFVATQAGTSGVAPWVGAADGQTWTRVGSVSASPNAYIVAVTTAASGFVAVGQEARSAAAWTSADGRSWSAAKVEGGTGTDLVSVAASGTRLVAFGQGADPRGDPAVFVSDDAGRSWRHVESDRRPDSSWPPVIGLTAGFLATGYEIWTSTDGVTWDDTAWARSRGGAPADLVPTVVASGARTLAAAIPDRGGTPTFWLGETGGP